MRAHYRFVDQWCVAAPVDAVVARLVDLAAYPTWWPQVRAVARLGPDAAWVRCRSALPYTLDLELEAVSRTAPMIEVVVRGDLEGFARFTLSPHADGTGVEFEQEVAVDGLLALASYVARPVLAWNHARMMAGCRTGLASTLAC